MNDLIAPSYVLSQILFIKIVGLCFFFAFLSLSQQVLGLFGSRGITPIDDIMHTPRQRMKKHPFLHIPTIFWISSSDKMLKGTTHFGILLSLLVILGFYPAPLLLILVGLYLSFTCLGTEFLSFQWDVLIIEVGFVAFLYAIQSPPPILVVVLAWFLLFRFLFSSGAVKLLSGCPEWHSLQAMKWHFETQPLPNRGGTTPINY